MTRNCTTQQRYNIMTRQVTSVLIASNLAWLIGRSRCGCLSGWLGNENRLGCTKTWQPSEIQRQADRQTDMVGGLCDNRSDKEIIVPARNCTQRCNTIGPFNEIFGFWEKLDETRFLMEFSHLPSVEIYNLFRKKLTHGLRA